jgi:hypothetical protein
VIYFIRIYFETPYKIQKMFDIKYDVISESYGFFHFWTKFLFLFSYRRMCQYRRDFLAKFSAILRSLGASWNIPWDRRYFLQLNLQTLETCKECKKTITTRILRAAGDIYHPECFKCGNCKKTLDGIPFTQDDSKKPFCICCYQE